MTWYENLTQPQATLIGLLITGFLFPIVSFLLNKFFGKKSDKADYETKLQGMVDKSINQTSKAMDELQQERDARKAEAMDWERKYSALENRLIDIEHAQAGPWVLHTETEFRTLPTPTVIRQSHKLELAPEKVN